MNELTIERRKALRAAAHHLDPVVSLGQHGLSEAVLKEIDRALKAHELIKVKLHGIEREDREQILASICTTLTCEPVQHIGNILILWREKPAETPAPKKTSPTRTAKPKTKKQAAAAAEKPRRRAAR